MDAPLSKGRFLGMPVFNWLILAFLAALYFVLFEFLRIREYDSPAYIGAARLLFGLEGGYEHQARIAKPMVLLLPGLYELLSGNSPEWIFILQNLIAFMACGWLIHNIAFRLVPDERTAFLIMLCYVLCQTFAVYSLLILADTPGWALELAIIRLALAKGQTTWTRTMMQGLLIGIGLLVKESMFIAAFFLGLNTVLNEHQNSQQKTQRLLCTGLPALVLLGINTILIGQLFKVSLLSWIIEANEDLHAFGYNMHYLQQVIRTLDLSWLFVVTGLFFAFKKQSFSSWTSERKAALLTVLIFFAGAPLLANFAHDRVLFMAAPLLLILTVDWMHEHRRILTVLVPLLGMLGLLATYSIYRYQTANSLPIYYLCGGAVFVIALAKFNNKEIKS